MTYTYIHMCIYIVVHYNLSLLPDMEKFIVPQSVDVHIFLHLFPSFYVITRNRARMTLDLMSDINTHIPEIVQLSVAGSAAIGVLRHPPTIVSRMRVEEARTIIADRHIALTRHARPRYIHVVAFDDKARSLRRGNVRIWTTWPSPISIGRSVYEFARLRSRSHLIE